MDGSEPVAVREAPQLQRPRWGPPRRDGAKKQRLDVSFGEIHTQNVQQLRKLNEHTFPVKYADKFYQEIPTLSKHFTQFGK